MSLIPDKKIDEKEKIRQENEELTKIFLENGGKIEQVPIGVSNDKLFKPANVNGKDTSGSEDY